MFIARQICANRVIFVYLGLSFLFVIPSENLKKTLGVGFFVFLTVSLFISSLFFKPVTAGCIDSDVTEMK